ncbi:MAG: S-layer homology domain-containing protein [Dysosmobacter sp.]
MKRRILASLLSLVMMLSLLPTAVWAVDDEGSTSSGNGWPSGATGITVATEKYSVKDYDEDKTNVTASTTIWYKIDSDTLTIGGKGAISDYSNTSKLTNVLRFTQADWYMVKDTIKNVVIEAGITGIGTLAIANMTHLESIEIKGADVELARGAVNNYQGNDGTLTITVPLSVYQQNKMGENGWFTESSQNPNPTIEFVISNVNDIEAHYADVLKLDAADSANWSAIAAAYEEYEALPDVVKTQLKDSVGTPLAEKYATASNLRGWPAGAKGINIALEGFNGSNMDKIGTSDTFWYLLDGSTLKLGGDGAFPYTGYDSSSATDHNLGFSHASWYDDRASITSVDVAEGITKLDYLNLTNLYNCDDIYLRNKEIELVNGAVCGYTGDANGKLTLHLYKSAYDKLPSGWYMLNNLTTAPEHRYLDPTLSYSFLEVEAFESKYEAIWALGVSLNDEQKETVKAAYNEYQGMDAMLQNQLMNMDTLSSGQTYGAKLLELYSLTTGGTVAKFPGTTDIYYSYDEETKTLTLTYTGSGTGTIPDYNQYTAPLGSVQIENVVIDSKITSVGAYALANHGDITVYASVNTTLAENYAAGSTVTLIYSETQAFIDTYAQVWTLTGVVPAGIVENGVSKNDAFVAVKNAVTAYKKLNSNVEAQLKKLKIDGGSTYYAQLLKVTGANDLDNMTKISGGIPNGVDEKGCFTYMDGIHWTLTKNDEGTDTWTLRFDTDTGVKAALPDFGNSTTNTTATDFRNQPWYSNCFGSAFKNKVTKTYLGEGITDVGRYGLIHLSNCTDFYFENPDGVDLAGYAFDYYSCFPAFKPNIYLHSNSTLAANWADDLNKGADEGKNHTTADFNLIYTDALAFEQNEAFKDLWTMNAADANTEGNASIIKSAMDAYSALSDKAKEQLKKDKCNSTDTYAGKLMALAKAIGLAGDIGSIQYTISSDGKTLTVTGSGDLSADLANNAWTDEKVGSVENLVIESAITINNGALNNMTALKTVDAVRGVKVGGGKNVFPNAGTILIRGYADAQNTSLESYAKAHNIKFQLKELNILCIGNSHTDDYTTYMQSILNDVNAKLDGTKVTFSRIVFGSRKIGLDGSYSNSNETNYSHESCIQDVVDKVNDSSATSKHDVTGAYFKSLNPAANTWDLIIIQDYRESCSTNSNYVFIDHLRNTIKNLRLLQPTAQVAWFMDWLDHSEDAAHYTDNSLENYKLASEKSVEGNPNFIVAGATFIRTAMTSYLGKAKNLEDTKPLHSSDTTQVSQIWRDNTHMSYETGRYLAGASVAAKVLTDVYSKEITFTTGDFYSALSYAPNSANSGVKKDWPGEFTPEIAEIVKASAKAAIENPTEITELTEYAKDPIENLKALVESADFTNTEWNETAIAAKAAGVLSEKAGAKVNSVSVSGNTATITLRYGYSETAATIYTPSDAAAQWTAYIESTNLGSTTVPGSDMKYSEVPAIQAALAKGYSDIWAAKTAEAANAALEASKENLLKTVKEYVKYLADTVYNNGAPTELNGNSYTVSKENYGVAVDAIDSANNVSGVLGAYDVMLDTQVCRTISSVSIMPDKESMVGSSTVTLTITKAPTDAVVSVTCDDSTVAVKDNGGGTYTVSLPNITKTYTFTASIEQSDTYTAASTSCTVSVTRKSSGSSSSSSGSSGSYAVSAPSTKNGDVTVSPKNASKGDRVTVTVTPDKGYELDKLTVKDASGNKLKLTDKGNGKYTFTMPGSKVTVSAEFVEEQAASIFADVPADAYYAKAVEWAVKKGITNGKANGLFGSNDPCTRGQIVTFLWRAAGSPAPKGTAKVPADVLPGSYCYDAVAWALENGITNGLADGTFGVNNTCTRGQSVTFLYRAMGTAPTTVNGFTDVAAGDFYAEAVAWAVENGVTNGTSASTFSPNAGCTRAQIVTFLFRTYQGK